MLVNKINFTPKKESIFATTQEKRHKFPLIKKSSKKIARRNQWDQ